MARIVSEIGRRLSRVFFGRIVVRELAALTRDEKPEVFTHFRGVDVKPMRAEQRVGAALFVKWKKTRAKSAGFLLEPGAAAKFSVRGTTFGKLRPVSVLQYKLNLKKRASARHAMIRIGRTAITRHNRLNFIKTPPSFEKAKMLALYSPIYQEKVKKSALDKSSGNLLFWYDSERVKMGERYHLLLLRVFGGEEPLKWVWLPADKRL
jgi:hypothetical protein